MHDAIVSRNYKKNVLTSYFRAKKYKLFDFSNLSKSGGDVTKRARDDVIDKRSVTARSLVAVPSA